MDFDTLLDFQLRMHSFEETTANKLQQIRTLENKLEVIGSLKIQSQYQMLQMVSEIQQVMKGVQVTFTQLKSQCYQLKIHSLYQVFKNLCCVMINAVKILADSFKIGLQRNLLQLIPSQNKNSGFTKAIKLQEIVEIEQQKEKKIKKGQEKSEFRQEMQFQQLCRNISLHKEAVNKTSASSAVTKLNEICLNWVKIVDNSDKMLEQAFYRKNQKFGQQLPNKSQYIQKILKDDLSKSIKGYFGQSINLILKKLYTQLYKKQYKKIKDQILGQKPLTKQMSQQTDLQTISKIKQLLKQKRNMEKDKQIERLNMEKQQITDQYVKASRNNELYVNRIKDLQRKLLKLMPMHIWENKQFYRQYLKLYDQDDKQAKQSKTKQNNQTEIKQKPSLLSTQSKFNNIYNHNIQQIEIRKSQQKHQEIQMTKKNSKLRLSYLNGRMKTDYEDQQFFQLNRNSEELLKKFGTKAKKQIRRSSIKMPSKQRPFQVVGIQQYTQMMKNIFEMIQQIKVRPLNQHGQEKENRNQFQKQKDKQLKQQSLMSNKIMKSPEIIKILQKFALRFVEKSINKCEQKMKSNHLKQKQFKFEQRTIKNVAKSNRYSIQSNNLMTNNIVRKFLNLKKKNSVQPSVLSKHNKSQTLYEDQNKKQLHTQLLQNKEQKIIIQKQPESLKQSNDKQNIQTQQIQKVVETQKIQQLNQIPIQKLQKPIIIDNKTEPKRVVQLPQKLTKNTEDINKIKKQNHFYIHNRFQRLPISQQRSSTRQNKYRQSILLNIHHKNQQKLNNQIQKITKKPNKNTQNRNNTLINVSHIHIHESHQQLSKQKIIQEMIQMYRQFKDNQIQMENKLKCYLSQTIDKLKKQKKNFHLRN